VVPVNKIEITDFSSSLYKLTNMAIIIRKFVTYPKDFKLTDYELRMLSLDKESTMEIPFVPTLRKVKRGLFPTHAFIYFSVFNSKHIKDKFYLLCQIPFNVCCNCNRKFSYDISYLRTAAICMYSMNSDLKSLDFFNCIFCHLDEPIRIIEDLTKNKLVTDK